MSQLALQSREGQSDLHRPLRSPARSSPTTASSDSPTIGRVQIPYPAAATTTNNGPPTSSSTYRSQRTPAPSPLQTTTAISRPPSVSPTRQRFPLVVHDSYTTSAVPEIVTTAHESALGSYETSYYHSDSSREPTPDTRAAKPALAPASPRLPNDTRKDADFALTSKHSGGSSPGLASTMASRTDSIGAPRNASMDSAMSGASSNKAMEDTTDIASLIKTAGSAEAVIQYLLKEKKSQAQQNSQLWRLVDKQRAMILGLNKDLERALKEKERYRKKLKELANDVPPLPAVLPLASQSTAPPPRIEVDTAAQPQALDIPVSPGLDSDSQRHSPIDVAMAPYPITPPADQPMIPNGPPSAVGELLDPSHAMPKPSEHALDQFDHEAEEHAADAARREADDAKDMPFNLGLPPSRSVPSEPPRMPPPMPPPQIPAPSPPQQTPIVNEDIAQFPAPPAPQTRKPPPAPLRLGGVDQSPTVPIEEDLGSDSDFDDILEVEEIKDEKRGRRRTRQEDEQERAILAKKEAEMRSLSKKSDSLAESPKAVPESGLPASPRIDQDISSLSGMLDLRAPALLTPGLPSSPRSAMAPRSPLTSPPLSPLGVAGFPSMPLSPRPPRQPIPLPLNTPVQTPSPPGEAPMLTSPKPLNIVKKYVEAPRPASPERLARSSPTERTRIYKGLVTEEHPDLLIPPNALPSVDIKVASSRMKPSRASLLSLTQLEEDPVFTLAIFSRSDGGELWRVEKDTSSLAKLDQRLKQFSAFTAKTPDRSLFTGHAPAKLDARRVALNHYFEELLDTPFDTNTALELCKFLSHNTLPPNADETGTSLVEGPSEVTQKTGPGGRPFRSGYLTKRGKNFGGWKARFFVLDGPHLKYYETPGGAHLGTIKLQKAQIGKQSQHNGDGQSPARNPATDDVDNQYRHAFLILEPKKKDPSSLTKHVLCAESDRERDQWVDALLRWIDYKDPDEEDLPKADAPQDRQGSSGSDRAHLKKKAPSRQQHAQQPYYPNDSEDTLIGVSYEATRQGEIPQGAPAKHGHHDLPMSSQQSLAISAPRDPQVISHSDSWGSKLSMAPPPPSQLAPPNLEEKKARKRSFFGFGPRTRTSSDGQDSLFGSESGSTGPAGNQYSGPVRQVFGASLAEAVRFNSPVDVRVPLPAVVYRCIQYLDAKNAIGEEGIFRLSGSNVVIKQLRERFNNESDINLLADETYYDIHAVASLLKLYLRELPTTILTRDLHLEFLTVTEMTDQRAKIAGLAELVQRLPQANATLLKYLIAFLIKIINHADVNKMTVRNVGIVFSPTLNIPAPVFALFLQNYEPIFGIEPTEYELPSPVTDSERRPSLPTDRPSFGDRRPSDSQRPSTSGTGSSPHRQRLMDAMREGQGTRSSPTPPPMNMQQMAQMNSMRTTPTPPPQRSMNYEPQYLAQQSQVPNNRMSIRPSYESNFMLPQGYDPSQLHTPAGRVNPGYDRPLYENNGAPGYDQPYTKARRESGVFMGNLNHQGSKSRLREEARY